MWKWTKRAVLASFLVGAATIVFFGTDAFSYARSSARMLRRAAKESVPVEFEIKRARDMLEELIPETHANLKIVAEEEVEVAMLEKELVREHQNIEGERAKIQALRSGLETGAQNCKFSGQIYTRLQVVEELQRRFENFRTAEQVMAGKEKLLESRKAGLHAAVQKLEKTRLARVDLAAQIESLEAQFRLVQAQQDGNGFQIDDSKLAKTQRLLGDLKKRLEVAQRVLARESRFVEGIPVDPPISEETVIETVDKHFARTRIDSN